MEKDIFSKIPTVFKGMPVIYINEKTISAGARYLPLDSKTQFNKKQMDLKADILEQGMLYPLELTDYGRLICMTGNQRLHILRFLGISMVPVVIRGNSIIKVQVPKKENYQVPKGARFVSGKERVKKKRKKK